MARVGYLTGINSKVLDKLALRGEELVHLGSDEESPRMNLYHLTRFDTIDLVITRFHNLKQLAQSYGDLASISDAIERCQESGIKLIIVYATGTKELIKGELANDNLEKLKQKKKKKLFEEVVWELDRKRNTDGLAYGHSPTEPKNLQKI